MQLGNLQQQVNKRVEVYYECLLKLSNYLQVKATNVFFITIFRASLQPYLRLATTSMARDTFIKHKKVVMICEGSGLIIKNYNALIIQPKSKPITQPIAIYTTAKQQLTCSNYVKTNHAKETCHNRKRKKLAIPIVPTKFIEPMAKITTQLLKPTKVPLKYPCIIYFNFEHHALDYSKKIEV